MWSKTRQILESRLAEHLKGRVSYHYDVYRTKGCKEKHDWWTEMHVLSIIVDGEAWFCTNPQFYRQYYRDGFYRFDEKSDNDISKNTRHNPAWHRRMHFFGGKSAVKSQ